MKLATENNDFATAETLLQQAQQTALASGSDDDKAVARELEAALLRTHREFSQAINAYEKAIALYKKSGNIGARALVNVQLAIAYVMRGQYRQGVGLCEHALRLAKPGEDNLAIANAHQVMGMAQAAMNEHAEAIKNITKAIALYQPLAEPMPEANSWQALASVYRSLGHYELAMEHLLCATRIFREQQSHANVARSLNNMGLMLKDTGEYEKALEYFAQAHAIHQSQGDVKGLYSVYANSSYALIELKRYDEAEVQAKLAMQQIAPTAHPEAHWNYITFMIMLYTLTNRLAEAEELCGQALQLAEETGEPQQLADVKGWLGIVWHKTQRLGPAKAALQEAVDIDTSLQKWWGLDLWLSHLYEIAEAEGDTTAALKYYRQRTEIDQRLIDEKIQQRMLVLRIQYDTEHKDAELEKLRAEKEALLEQKQRNASNYRLSPREHAILKLMVDGLSYKMIAAQLGIGYETVRDHIAKLYKKLSVATNTEAVAKAVKEGLV